MNVPSNRVKVVGYVEEGTTTTPFDMQVRNKTDRFHICIYAIEFLLKDKKIEENKAKILINEFNELLEKHQKYIVENGEDIPEVKR